MTLNRIPRFQEKSSLGMLHWFTEMLMQGLLFHPDDDPADIQDPETGASLFSDAECTSVRAVLNEMFEKFGDDVYDAAHPVYMYACGIQPSPVWPT
jgi:hypothetical protein